MPWEEMEEFIRSGHRSPEDFEPDTLRTITLSEKDGVKAIVGKPKGSRTMEVQSYLFEKNKGWTLQKAKDWFSQNAQENSQRLVAVLPVEIQEKITEKPLRIRGVALAVGMSRNLNVYTPQELAAFAEKLVGAPMYIEHIAVPNAVGKVTRAEWDGQHINFEAEVFEEETADKIRKGLIQHVSVGADYDTADVFTGRVPHGLHNAEISLVAVPGIPEANFQIIEKLRNAPKGKESLLKQPSEPVMPVSEAILLIEQLLPSPLVQRSWSLGPQRMCQELRRTALQLKERYSHKVTGSS